MEQTIAKAKPKKQKATIWKRCIDRNRLCVDSFSGFSSVCVDRWVGTTLPTGDQNVWVDSKRLCVDSYPRFSQFASTVGSV